MAKRVKIETAGQLVRMCCYTMQLPQDSDKARAEKKKMSSAARSRINARTSWNKCRLVMSANFTVGDMFLTLTYSDQYLPTERAEAVERLRGWIDEIRAEYKRAGQAVKYIYATENAHGEGRYHLHLVVNRIDHAEEFMQAHWPYGHIKFETVASMDFTALSKYFTKEGGDNGRKLGQQTWTPSRGLRKPEIKTEFVSDNFTLVTPPGCITLANPSDRNEYGEFAYLEYLVPAKQLKKDAE